MQSFPDARERFSGRVRDYVLFRPSYPPGLLSLLKDLVRSGGVIADIGSGTGIFSGQLLEAGFSVCAIEPNASMRLAAETSLGRFAGFRSIDGEGERTTLPDHSVDAVTVAQAFHWFATKEAAVEFDRILAGGGVVLLIWNDRRTDCDEFHREYEDLLLRYGTDYVRVNHRNITEELIRGLFGGWSCKKATMENHQDLTFEGLVGRLKSSSYCPTEEHPHHTALLSAVKKIFDRDSSGGIVRMQYECVAYILRRID